MLVGDVTDFRVGTTPVVAVHRGATKVWPWTPVAIPGLAAWIDPAQDTGTYGNGAGISSYTSHDPAGRVFTPLGTPIYQLHNTLSGTDAPAIDFPNSGLTTTGYNPGTTGITFVMVSLSGEARPYRMMWSYNGISRAYEMRHSDGGFNLQCVYDYPATGAAPSAPFTESPMVLYIHMMVVDSAAGTVKGYINNTLQINVTGAAPMPNAASNLSLGWRPDGYLLDGRVVEALAISGPISDDDRTKLVAYLRAKHTGMTVP